MPLEDRPAEDLNPAELVELVNRYRVSPSPHVDIRILNTHEESRS